MSGEYVATVHDQVDPKDAIDVARREAESIGLRVLATAARPDGTLRDPHRGTIPQTWIVVLRVTKR